MAAINISVAPLSTLVIGSNSSRKKLTLINVDPINIIYINTTTAAPYQGVRLNPNGGTWDTTSTSAFYAITSGAVNATLAGMEV